MHKLETNAEVHLESKVLLGDIPINQLINLHFYDHDGWLCSIKVRSKAGVNATYSHSHKKRNKTKTYIYRRTG